jgi:hypothetical protein
LGLDIVLDVKSEGIHLRFDPISQRLKVFFERWWRLIDSLLMSMIQAKSLSPMGEDFSQILLTQIVVLR